MGRVDFAGSGLGSGTRLGSIGGRSRGRKSRLAIALPLLIGLGFVGFQYCSAEGQVVPITGREQKVSLSDDQQMQLGAQYYDEFLQRSSASVVASGPSGKRSVT